jgi:MFS family permease
MNQEDSSATSLTAFYKGMNGQEKATFWTCFLGWGIDALDFMIYPLVIGTIITLWHVDRGTAGFAVTVTLLASAVGGWLSGYVADRIGRVRTLQYTVVWFCVLSLVCALVQNFDQLIVARAILGFGFGGEWAAGAVLIAETIRPEFRGRAVGVVQSAWALGWGSAVVLQAIVFSFVPDEIAWRAMFAVGAVPGVLLMVARRYVREPEMAQRTRQARAAAGDNPSILEIFKPATSRTTIVASIFVMGCHGGYYAVTTWLPTFLKNERHLTVVGSTGYLAFLILGSFTGYLFGAWMADRFGRKRLFVTFAILAIIMVIAYTQLNVSNAIIMWLGFPLGFCASAYLAGVGAFLSELYPTRLRGSGQGFCYNFGRGMAALFPALVGFFSERFGLALAIAIFAVLAYAFLLVGASLLPETRGTRLENV